MGDLDKCRELPDHLVEEEVLTLLPVESLCRFRSVCKTWNDLFSSTEFIATKWAQKACDGKQWLVAQNAVLLSACRFLNGTWNKNSSVSLSFLRKSLCIKRKGKHTIHLCGSAAGLFLMYMIPRRHLNPFTLVVCNPLTRKFLKLPPLSSIRHNIVPGIVGGEGKSRDTYKVVVVGNSESLNAHETVEIYNSSDKSWRIAGHLPENVQKMSRRMVFCAGSFYWPVIIRGESTIWAFNLEEGTSTFVPFPNIDEGGELLPRMLTCGSQLLFAGYVFGNVNNHELLQVILWRFEKLKVTSTSSSSPWKEIARIPQSDVQRFFSTRCVGVGDWACFIVAEVMKVKEVLAYSLTDHTWRWLPMLRRTLETYQHIMAFEPRPDMKVG